MRKSKLPNLVLTRYPGSQVTLEADEDRLQVRILWVKEGKGCIVVGEEKFVVSKGENYSFRVSTYDFLIFINNIEGAKLSLSFRAPPEVRIVRRELV